MLLRIIYKIFSSFLICACLWLAGLCWFITLIPTQPDSTDRKADAIVVLTGGSGRLQYALELLAEGKGNKLFISGVSETATIDELLRRATPDIQNKIAPMTKSITLGRHAVNTIGNAEETIPWLQKEGFKSIRLVTANYHMPRSLQEFENNSLDLTIIPTPVFPGDFDLSNWWSDTNSRILLLGEYHKFLASKMRHWVLSNKAAYVT